MRHQRHKGKPHSIEELKAVLRQMREEVRAGQSVDDCATCNSNDKTPTNICFSDKYLIVEKSKVIADYQMANGLLTNSISSQSEKNNAIVIKSFLEDYFGKETFNSIKK